MKITPWPWQIIETENSWNLYGATPIIGERGGMEHHGHPLKIIKAPKKSIEYAEYWPNEVDGEIIRLAPEMYEVLTEMLYGSSSPPSEVRQRARKIVEKVWEKRQND